MVAIKPDKVTPYPSENLPLARAIKGEEVIDDLLFIRNPVKSDGIFINVSASPLKDIKGRIIGGTVIFHDITENKRTETILRQSEERVKAQFKGIPIPTYVWQHGNNDFTLIDYNNAAEVFYPKLGQQPAGYKTLQNVRRFTGDSR